MRDPPPWLLAVAHVVSLLDGFEQPPVLAVALRLEVVDPMNLSEAELMQ